MPDKKHIPKPKRLSRNDPFYKEIIKKHNAAFRAGEFTYEDPKTGLTVFTALYHLQRGYCCGSGCRHCPYAE